MLQVIAQLSVFLWVVMSIMFVIGYFKKTYVIVDMAWGTSFMFVAFYTLFLNSTYMPRQLLITTLILLWGTRITVYLFMRNKGKGEDPRFEIIKKSWGVWEPLYSYFLLFLSQGLLILLISYPVILVNTSNSLGLSWLDAIGVAIWIIGFLFETIGDWQLYVFLKNPLNKGMLMRSGLWQYTRHPNYFGESLMWWGIWIIALSVPFGWSGIISPLTITSILLYVSGVPMAEKQLERHPDFASYKAQTNMFIPWFPKNY